MLLTISFQNISANHLYEDIKRVKVPGADGHFEILPGHAPFIGTLLSGSIIYEKDNTQKYFPIQKGIIKIMKNKITVWYTASKKIKSEA